MATTSQATAVQADLVTMTGNVAQVFVTGQEWAAALQAARQALRPGGRAVFESRDPAKKAWLEWNRDLTGRRVVIPSIGPCGRGLSSPGSRETWSPSG
jgi:hypothetical protein